MDAFKTKEGSEESTVASGSQKSVKETDKFHTVHLVAFIICAVIGRQYSLWNVGLSQGFGQFMIAEILMTANYVNTYFCFAEIWSAVPFSGGIYGLARAMMGFYPGFLVGGSESFNYINQSANGVLFLGEALCMVFEISPRFTLLFVVVFYALAVCLCNYTNMVVVRRSFVVLATVSVLILLIFLFGSLKDTDFHANASLHVSDSYSAPENWFAGGMKTFMLLMSCNALHWAGMKCFTQMSGLTENPKVTMPRAVCIVVPIIFALSMFTVFVNAAQPGGILHSSMLPSPVGAGYVRIFHIVVERTHFALVFLSYPSAFGLVLAYLIPNGILLQSLGNTNLLPSFLGLNHNTDYSQGTIITALLGFLMCVMKFYRPDIDLQNISFIMNCFTNLCVCFCYIKLKITCPTLERGFVNPVGVPACVFSSIMFLLMFITAAFLQPNHTAITGAVVLFGAVSVYYWGLAVQHQTLCKEEDKVFLMLHVKNFNNNKKKRAKKGTPRGKVQAAEQFSTEGKSETSTSAATHDRSVVGGLLAQIRGKVFGNNVVSPLDSARDSRSSAGVSSANVENNVDDVDTRDVEMA